MRFFIFRDVYIADQLRQHEETYDPDHIRDFCDSLIKSVRESEDDWSKGKCLKSYSCVIIRKSIFLHQMPLIMSLPALNLDLIKISVMIGREAQKKPIFGVTYFLHGP